MNQAKGETNRMLKNQGLSWFQQGRDQSTWCRTGFLVVRICRRDAAEIISTRQIRRKKGNLRSLPNQGFSPRLHCKLGGTDLITHGEQRFERLQRMAYLRRAVA